MHSLKWTIISPWILLIILIIIHTTTNKTIILRKVALFGSILIFIISSIIWIEYYNYNHDSSFIMNFEFIFELSNIFLETKFGIDSISLIFIILTTYIFPIAILSTWDRNTHKIKEEIIYLVLLEAILISTFATLSLFMFFILFESSLIPLYLLIGTNGSSKTRIRASILLFMYTLAGSFPMLIGILEIIQTYNSNDMEFILHQGLMNWDQQKTCFILIFIGIAVKIPLFPLHLWLFRAHSEGTLSTSIILASLILKLAVFAYIRLLLGILPHASYYYSPLVLLLGIINIIYGSLATFRQTDSKILIAYSSVAHMGIVVIGLASGTVQGIIGSIILSIAHGLVSPALFIIVGGIIYDRYHTRALKHLKGLGSINPLFKSWFLIVTICSIGTPGSLNWIGEFLCFFSTYEVSFISTLFSISGIFLGALYSLWIYSQITSGILNPNLQRMPDITIKEHIMLFSLIFPIILIGLIPNILLDLLNQQVWNWII